MNDEPTSTDLTRLVQEALNQRIPWPRRLATWLRTRITGREATAGGYWGGVTMWDRAKAIRARAAKRRD